MSKSHASLGQKVCLVTGKIFESGEIILDKRMKNSLEEKTITGYGISPEAQEKIDKGFIALIEMDPTKSEINEFGKVDDLSKFYRTGKIAYIKNTVFEQIFNVASGSPFQFIEIKAFEYIEEMAKNAKDSENPEK